MEDNSEFVVLHLPLQSHLIRYFSNLPPPRPLYDFLLEHARESYHYIALEEHLEPFYLDDAYWSETKHYGPRIHALLAEVVANEIVSCILNGTCPLPRFDDPSTILIANPTSES